MLRVNLESPANGWLAVGLSVGDWDWQAVVSYTPNDYLTELLDALLSFAEYEDTPLVAWANTEPEAFRFTFTRHGTEAQFAIQDEREVVVFSVNETLRSIVEPFWRALSRLRTTFLEEQWRNPFPEREMAALAFLVNRLKADAP